MNKIIGTWNIDNGQTFSYFTDSTFSADVPEMGGRISGQFALKNGKYYLFESGGSVISTFEILHYRPSSMLIGHNNGEMNHCKRNNNDEKWLRPGGRVVLHSLQGGNYSSLNGRCGTVDKFDRASLRFVVFVDGFNQEVKIRDCNLKPPPAVPALVVSNPVQHQINDPLQCFAQELQKIQETQQLKHQQRYNDPLQCFAQQLQQVQEIQYQQHQQNDPLQCFAEGLQNFQAMQQQQQNDVATVSPTFQALLMRQGTIDGGSPSSSSWYGKPNQQQQASSGGGTNDNNSPASQAGEIAADFVDGFVSQVDANNTAEAVTAELFVQQQSVVGFDTSTSISGMVMGGLLGCGF